MTWSDDIRASQQLLELPHGFGRIDDMTSVIDVLSQAGMPGAEVTSFNQLTLGDGRVALVTNCSPFWPVVAIDEIPPRHHLVLIARAAIPTPFIQLATVIRKGILLVDVRRGLVWDEGRLVNGDVPRRGASRYRYAVFAAAKVLVRHGADVDRIMTMAGLTRMQSEDSLDVLQPALRPRALADGWEAQIPDDLLDWILQAYPGFGGISTYWKSRAPLAEQAQLVSAIPGVWLSGTWAGSQAFMTDFEATSITAFTRTGVDLDSLGFVPASRRSATVTLVLPEDRTIFGLANSLGPTGCTDEFTTAHVVAHDPRLTVAQRADAFEGMRRQLRWQIELDEDLRWNMRDRLPRPTHEFTE